MFIEYNGNWTHGGHPYDRTSLDDISKVEEWEDMSKEHPYYKNAIYTWTVLDVKKQQIAKQNKLNYLVIY